MIIWRYIVSLLLFILLLLPALAARVTIDLCDQQWNSAQQLGTFIVLTGEIHKRAEDDRETRLLTVDRVISGNVAYKHGEQLTVTVKAMWDNYLEGPGKYLFVCQRGADGKLLFSDDLIIHFGPLVNQLALRSFDDPVISDAQLVLDTLSIPSAAVRWERINALWPHMTNRPFVMECFLRTMASSYRESIYYTRAIYKIADMANKLDPSTLVFTDQLACAWNPIYPVPSPQKNWLVSKERKAVLERLAATLPKNDANRGYVEAALAAFPTGIPPKCPLPPTDASRIHDVADTDVWPLAAVAEFPAVAPGAERCTVNVERVLAGEAVLTTGKQDLTLAHGAELPAAGRYVLFMSQQQEQPCYGAVIFVLGSVVNYVPVTSANDPAVDDLRTLLLCVRQQEHPQWHEMREDVLLAKNHPVLTNYNLRQMALRASIMEHTFDQASLAILRHPADYSLPLVVLADQLFTTPSWNDGPLSDAAQAWKKSPERKALFSELKQHLTPADDQEPYYSRIFIDRILQEFQAAK